MSKPKHMIAAVLVLIVASGIAMLWVQAMPRQDSHHEAVTQPGLTPVECWFAVPPERKVDCAEMKTDPERGGFVLPVVIIRDQSPDHREDPLVYLSGGPGNSSFLETDNIDHWFYWADRANLSRDLILVDQRGTGLSRPRFHCHSYNQFVRDSLGENLTLKQEHQAALAAVRECVGLLEARGQSLDQYSTTHSARDMAELMDALEYEHWNVMGGSYGTRLALEWLRLSEDGIRAVILDSVYPLDKGSLAEWPALLHGSFEFFWQVCEGDNRCGEHSSDLRDRFWQAMEVLRKEPVTLTVPLWQGGWPLKVVVNDHRFLAMVYSAFYGETLHDDILLAIDEVLNGGTEALQKLSEHSVNSELAPEFNALVYLAVDCAESPAVTREEYERARDRYPQWSAYTDHAWRYDMCRPIPQRRDLKNFKQALETEIPVLVLSGGFDPVTPAAWARELAARLPNSHHWHLERAGHGVVASSVCVHENFRAFLDAPFADHPLPCD